VPERIKSGFKYVSILSYYNPVWQTIPYVNNTVKQYLRQSYLNRTFYRIVITLTLILTLQPDPDPNPNCNPNPTYPNKPTEPYQTVLTLTDTVGLQCAPSDRHTSQIN